MQLVWYCPFWSIRNHFCVIQFSSYWFSSFHNVYPTSIGPWMFMVWFWLAVPRALAPVVVKQMFPQNQGPMFMFCHWYCMVIAVVMHPVDMGRFCLPLWSIIWCRLADRPAAQTSHTQIDTCIFCSNIHL